MEKYSFRTKIWLYNLLENQGPLTLEEINERWHSCPLSGGDKYYPRRTFLYDIKVLSAMFDVDIVCDSHTDKYEVRPHGSRNAVMKRGLGFFEFEIKEEKIKIVTDRLIIRTPEEGDVHDIFVLMSDLEIAAFTGFRPMSTLSEAEVKIRRKMDSRMMFCISEKDRPERTIGVFEITQDKYPSGEEDGLCECVLCYFLHKEARGKGYMTEVMRIMKHYLFNEMKADWLTVVIRPWNDASRRFALKNGFAYEGMDYGEIGDLEYYTLYKEEYLNHDEKLGQNYKN